MLWHNVVCDEVCYAEGLQCTRKILHVNLNLERLSLNANTKYCSIMLLSYLKVNYMYAIDVKKIK